MDDNPARAIIGTILRHDRKVTSYKLALIRSINDVAGSFPALAQLGDRARVAIPLRMLAEWWVAYYWPFAGGAYPLLQGAVAGGKQDISFRPALAELRSALEGAFGAAIAPADGFYLRSELRIARRRALYGERVLAAYEAALRAIMRALEMPIRYAGPAGREWSVFPRPARLAADDPSVAALPGAQPGEPCLLVGAELWAAFQSLSGWIEALCIHEWCLFTEALERAHGGAADRGDVFRLLTARPDNRRPLDWERHSVDLLLQEGAVFICPWTERRIDRTEPYDLDHLVPLAVYPTNELWNLLPADPAFNQRAKRDRLPSAERLGRAAPHLLRSYGLYLGSQRLGGALRDDALLRFELPPGAALAPAGLADAVVAFVGQLAGARNLARF